MTLTQRNQSGLLLMRNSQGKLNMTPLDSRSRTKRMERKKREMIALTTAKKTKTTKQKWTVSCLLVRAWPEHAISGAPAAASLFCEMFESSIHIAVSFGHALAWRERHATTLQTHHCLISVKDGSSDVFFCFLASLLIVQTAHCRCHCCLRDGVQTESE